MRSKQDDVDVYGFSWSRQRRINLGIIDCDKLEPRERLGKLRSTLAQVKDERIAAGESGKVNQDFPEVYTGMALVFHMALQLVPGMQRMWAHMHYVWREISIKVKAQEMDVSQAQYWILGGNLKSFIRGYVAVNKPIGVHQWNRHEGARTV